MVVRRAAVLTTALGLAAAVAAVAPAGVAVADDSPVVVLQKNLDGPFGLDRTADGNWVVAQDASGKVTRLGPNGFRNDLVRHAGGVAGVAVQGNSVYSVLGGGDENGPPPAGGYAPTTVLRTDLPGKTTRVLANLTDYELAHNPDGQKQFRKNGKPYDALSNPFSMTASPWGLLVADGGANDVLKVDPDTGAVSTFFVPPNVTDVKGCQGHAHQSNPGVRGCDPVPTGVAVVGSDVYVVTLGAEAPGGGKVYKLDSAGDVEQVWGGLTAPTGIAVDPSDGSIYVSEVEYGAPQGDPGPGFDPSSVGRITRIDPATGDQTHAQVTMPTGLRFYDGHLYSTAWSIAFFLGIQHAGEVVQVNPSAFS